MAAKGGSTEEPVGARKHRIPGKKQTAPYTAAPGIEVPEPKPKHYDKPKKIRSSDKSTERGAQNYSGGADQPALTITIPHSTLQAVGLLSLCDQQRYGHDQGTEYAKLSMRMSCVPEQNIQRTAAKRDSEYRRPEYENRTTHADMRLGRQSPPFYTPRVPTHVQNRIESSSESDDENNTPWGRRVTGIKVTRVNRKDDEVVAEDIPEGMLPVCPRCGVAVYQAEQKLAAGRAFHDKCFKCCVCEAFLDSLRVSERNGEIFCKSCYIRQFGPKGYDFGPGEGALRME